MAWDGMGCSTGRGFLKDRTGRERTYTRPSVRAAHRRLTTRPIAQHAQTARQGGPEIQRLADAVQGPAAQDPEDPAEEPGVGLPAVWAGDGGSGAGGWVAAHLLGLRAVDLGGVG